MKKPYFCLRTSPGLHPRVTDQPQSLQKLSTSDQITTFVFSFPSGGPPDSVGKIISESQMSRLLGIRGSFSLRTRRLWPRGKELRQVIPLHLDRPLASRAEHSADCLPTFTSGGNVRLGCQERA